MKLHRLALIAALAVLPTACALTARAGSRAVPATAKQRIEVSLFSGELELRGWDKDEVRVESTDGDPPAINVSADEIVISGGGLYSSDLVVSYPAKARLDARVTTGNITAKAPRGPVNVRTVAGEITIDDATAAVRANAVSGGIRARGLKSGGRLRSVSGDIRVKDATGEVRAQSVSGAVEVVGACTRASVRSQSGDVHFEGTIASGGELRGKSFSGNVVVDLGQRDFDLRARSRSGSVILGGLLPGHDDSSSRAKGRVGKGGVELDLSTFSGNIKVRVK